MFPYIHISLSLGASKEKTWIAKMYTDICQTQDKVYILYMCYVMSPPQSLEAVITVIALFLDMGLSRREGRKYNADNGPRLPSYCPIAELSQAMLFLPLLIRS